MTILRKVAVGVFWVIVCAHASLGAEADNAEILTKALQARSVVTFTYKGQARTVEPHALGKANDDRPALLAWQTSGGSNTEPPPGWRVFLVAEIAELKATDQKFEKPRADYNAKARGLKSVETDVRASEAAPATAEK